ncbi:penicillin amidase [Polymorphobacter multimanifer]|uniref:Penicillin amidase n=1 Tax=Polymorphobacter multimanifer TaxID=1070431 RepID=A0A841L8D2_9SPHN|nr:penicillin acylase family protein [Polymorphobacter multimanifer]MBB6228897.1 penicillin amidase [Polymorphobacter multimanifer]
MQLMVRTALAAFCATSALAQTPPPPLPPGALLESRSLAGLSAPGEIAIDRWGISHIKAATPEDAFFLQGYATARDRLWQIDLWRKRGLGRLAASFGAAFVEQDRASRLFLYRSDMAAEWAAYPAAAKGWTQAFAAGINAYVSEVEAGRAAMPEEFAATGSRPERWTADDIVRIRSNALVSNLPSEVARARAICAAGVALEPLRRELSPAHSIDLAAAADPCTIPADVLKDFQLGTGGVSFTAGKIILQDTPSAIAYADPDLREGSNNWVVGPSRTSTGRPILAGDPHRAHGVPSLRYVVHMEAPGLHIAGAGEPALPGISFGHNEDIGWALTIFAVDQQDLVVNPPRTSLRTVTETIEVKGEAPRTVELRFTADGPVIHTDPATGRSFSLRATWDRPGASAYFNASWLWQAKDWAGFKAGSDKWGGPPLNLLFAGKDGDIGWAAAGFLPRRSRGDGLLPVIADGRSGWQGLRPASDLPSVRNPAKGWFATANEMNVPSDFPNQAISFEWGDRSRIDRIAEVIGTNPRFSLTDAMALQADAVSPLARRGVALLAAVTPSPETREMLGFMAGWDGHEHEASPQAALFEVWTKRHLAQAAVAALVPEAARPAFGNSSLPALMTLLEKQDPLLGPDPAAMRDRILATSLQSAWAETVKLLGADPARWRWGSIHKAMFVPDLAIPGREDARQIGPLPIGGSASTPMASGSPRNDFIVRHGASVRMVLDVGAWDNSLIINSPGQSGDAGSPHYRDLFPRWAAGQMVPFRWSRAAVMADAERVISVTPAR